MRKSIFLFCIQMMCITSFGTTVVVYIDANSVVIGSDSHHKYVHPNGLITTGISPKIHKSGNFFFCLSGFVNDELNAKAIVRDYVSDLLEINLITLESMKVVLTQETQQYLERIKKNNINLFNDIVGSRGEILNIAIVGSNEQVPFYAFVRVYLKELENIKVISKITYVQTTDYKHIPYQIFTFGNNKGINKLFATCPDFNSQSPSQVINKLIAIECEASPDRVCKPVDILEISSKGINWLQRSPGCPIEQ